MEVWKNVKEYDGLYQVSNIGNVRSKSRNGTSIGSEWNIIKTRKTNHGYIRVTLSKFNKPKTHFVHRLMITSFISDPPSSIHQTNHINGIKDDNRIENLEWVTPSENKIHSIHVLEKPNGFLGKKHNDESKIKMSEYRKGKTSPGYNHNNIIVNGVEYKGIRCACKQLGLNRSVLKYNLKRSNMSFYSKGVFYKIDSIKV